MGNGLVYLWVDRKLVAQFQNRIGPRWFQPLADMVKLLSKEEIVPAGVDARLFNGLPILALAGALTAALYVPLVGLPPAFSFPGDLIVTRVSAQRGDDVPGAGRRQHRRPVLAHRRDAHADAVVLV